MLLRRIASRAFRTVKNESAVRRAIARSKKPGSSPKDWFAGMDDETWFWMNITGRDRSEAIASLVPKMPEVSMQGLFTGQSGHATLGKDLMRIESSRLATRRHL